jgi:adenylate kinase
MHPPRLFILGRQGAGKGTQCQRLADRLGIEHVSTGELFRAAVASGSRLGEKVQFYLDAGELVPDDVVLDVVVRRLALIDAGDRGFVLDGFPRTVSQADALVGILGTEVCDLAIEIDVPTETALPRLVSRRVCRGCGRSFTAPNPSVERWRCEICDGVVARRADDTEVAIRRRLAVYDEETAPLLVWLHSRGLLVSVDGTGTPDQVHARLVGAAGSLTVPIAAS